MKVCILSDTLSSPSHPSSITELWPFLQQISGLHATQEHSSDQQEPEVQDETNNYETNDRVDRVRKPAKDTSLTIQELHVCGFRQMNESGKTREVFTQIQHDSVLYAHRFFASSMAGFAGSKAMKATVHKMGVDLLDVHALYSSVSHVSYKVASRLCIPYIITPGNRLDNSKLAPDKRHRFRHWLYESKHLQMADAFRATSDQQADTFRQAGLLNPIAIIPQGVEVSTMMYQNDLIKPTRTIAYIGPIQNGYGVEYLLRAWTALAYHRPGWELRFYGDINSRYGRQMQQLTNKISSPRTTWHALDHDENPWKDVDLCVFAPEHPCEGFEVQKGLSKGIPVLTSTATPWSQVASHHCGWSIRLTHEGLRSGLEKATASPPGQLKAMGQKGQQWMQNEYSWSKVTADVMELYGWVTLQCKKPDFVYM